MAPGGSSTPPPAPVAPPPSAPSAAHPQTPVAKPQPKVTTAQPPTDPEPEHTQAAAGGSGCEIRFSAGNCYAARQFCRNDDLDRSTHDADGRVIYCRMVSGSRTGRRESPAQGGPEQVLVGLEQQAVLPGGGQAVAVQRDRPEGVGGLLLQFGRRLGEEVEERAGLVGEAVVAAQGLGDGGAVAAR
ncbi:hypothetical protein ACIG5E_22465 [Kitasatospora sp. NPDC053057]|uniref:hypothetical protein n=1 Tax=Kitasatospora sp. NPDC053057 TaxID=3364062 RepID=UPI0037C933F2